MAGDILDKLKKTVARQAMIVPGDTVLVAFSGGADSTALLHLLRELRRETPFDLALAHFNHRLRASADADERCAREIARALGLRFIVGRRNVRDFARRRGLNVEEAARMLRYEFLERAAARVRAAKIATGHTLNDQAETLLIRLLRGSGTRGLAGIYPVHGKKIVRPLLDVSRREVEAYCRRQKLAFREDETNLDKRYLRNKVRLELIPYLERRYEPNLLVKLGRLAAIFREEESVLEGLAQKDTRRLIFRRSGCPVLDARRLARLPRGLARRAVRIFIERTAGDLRRISFEDVESIVDLDEGKEATLPGELHLRREAGLIRIKTMRPAPAHYALLWDGRGRLPIPGAPLVFSGRRIAVKIKNPLSFDDQKSCFCDADKLRFPLLVRSRQAGDIYRPLGAPGKKKLKEILRAKRIPLSDRNTLPVFCSEGRIIWVPGLPVAEEYKVNQDTKTIFSISKKMS